MPFSTFTLKRVAKQFNLTVVEAHGHFTTLPPVNPTPLFQSLLAEVVPLAAAINTEKARSELLVTNVLLELRRTFDPPISFFSGVELDVSRDENLTGFCDFLVSRNPQQLYLSTPVLVVVEAKNDNLPAGLGQCVAEMVAVDRLNATEGNPVPRIYGTVTSGTDWLFARLESETALIDLREYSLNDPPLLLGILHAMMWQTA